MNRSDRKDTKVNPHDEANRVSKMTWFWLRDLYKTGYNRPITEDDIFKTKSHHESERIAKRFTEIWNEELKSGKPNVFRLLYKAYGKPILIWGILFSISETLNRCFQPLFLGLLLTYFVEPMPKSEAYLYAGGLVFCSLVPVLTFSPFMFYLMELSMKLRIGSSRLIYDKILRMSKSCQVDGLQGRVINLLTNDLGKFDFALAFLHDLWKGPLEVFLLGYLSYREIGYAGIVGILFILSFIPIQSVIGKMATTYRIRTTKRTDIRVRMMNEIINGIQIIKFYAWERNFAKVVDAIRQKELRAVKGTSYILASIHSLWVVAKISLFLTLITYVYSGNVLTARKVFIVSAYFSILQESMVHFWPLALTFCAEGYVSCKRLKDFLLLSENKPAPINNIKQHILDNSIGKNEKNSDDFPVLKNNNCYRRSDEKSEKIAIKFDNVCASWINEIGEPNIGLQNFSLEMNAGNLYAIVGSVGSGKSSLLQAVLGELEIDSGKLEVNGLLSYANQENFVFEGSIKSNILFNEAFDESRFNQVVSVCGLQRDIEMFEFGIETLVGEKGISLSGGQKARINLARAVYRQADIYLLDDPLSAVDSHVGKRIFKECIVKFLHEKTVLLVTHQVQHLTEIDNIIVMENGRMLTCSSYEEIKKLDFPIIVPMENQHEKTPSIEKAAEFVFKEVETVHPVDDEQELEKESQDLGKVGIGIYMKYFSAIKSVPLLIFITILRLLCQFAFSFVDWFVAYWVNFEESLSQRNQTENVNSSTFFSILPGQEATRDDYINTYILSIVVLIVVVLLAQYSFFYSLIRASKNLHDLMFRGLTKTYMRFFNQNPSGRILNRFSKDIGSIDTILPQTMFECISILLEVLAILVLVTIVNFYFIIPSVILGIILITFRHVYMCTSRNVKRVESISRSPIYAHTNATLQGLATIRAFKAEDAVTKEFNKHLNLSSSTFFMYCALNRSFAFWLDMICVIYIAIITFALLEVDAEKMPGGNVGLILTQIMGMVNMTQWGIRQSSELENQMVSVERILNYAELPSEDESGYKIKTKPSPGWPSKGEIEFKNLSLFYNDDGKPAIKNLSFHIKSQEKIGIVGRTGSGKSSIIQALFRMTTIEGSIKIDGVDTQSLTLEELRKNISIIPQDPILFGTGSLRSNLDPFDEKSDDEIWKVLDQVELKETVSSIPGGLNCRISDGGSNFSLGQRQLICLGRALLRRNRILVLDEATASVDYKTDALIQETINTEFSECTVLTIAHRLQTVINADKILVMNDGEMVEFDHPHSLLKNGEGYLSKLVNDTSSVLVDIAKENYEKKFS